MRNVSAVMKILGKAPAKVPNNVQPAMSNSVNLFFPMGFIAFLSKSIRGFYR